MNGYDPQKAARVWQRVQESKPEAKQNPMEDLEELIFNAEIAAGIYGQLARRMPKEAPLLQKLSREKQQHRNALRGIWELVNGGKCPVHRPTEIKDPTDRLLCRCYGQSLRSLKAYEGKREDPEYGHVFRKLAEQEREHGVAVLDLIGRLERK